MEEPKKRWRLLALVAMGLVIVGLLSLGSSAWATPGQKQAQQSVPFKTVDKTVVHPGDEVVFTITLPNPGPGVWNNVVIIDRMDPWLRIDDIETTPAADDVDVVGQTITVSYNTVNPGTTVVVKIYCTVREIASPGREIPNQCCLWIDADAKACSDVSLEVEEEFVPEMGSLLLLGSGLAGLAGYAGMKWRVRKK